MYGEVFIIEGLDNDVSKCGLYSAMHGAGRVLGRRQAAGKTKITRRWRCRDYRKCDFAGAQGGFRRGPNNETPKCPNCGHKLQLEEMSQIVKPGVVETIGSINGLSCPG